LIRFPPACTKTHSSPFRSMNPYFSFFLNLRVFAFPSAPSPSLPIFFSLRMTEICCFGVLVSSFTVLFVPPRRSLSIAVYYRNCFLPVISLFFPLPRLESRDSVDQLQDTTFSLFTVKSERGPREGCLWPCRLSSFI